MSLTDEDLQAIARLLKPIQSDMQEVKGHMENVEQRMKTIENDIREVKSCIENVENNVQNVERHLTSVELALENETNHNIQLLAENHIHGSEHSFPTRRSSDLTLRWQIKP